MAEQMANTVIADRPLARLDVRDQSKVNEETQHMHYGRGKQVTPLKFPLDASEANTFIRFTVVEHTKLTSGLSEDAGEAVVKVTEAASKALAEEAKGQSDAAGGGSTEGDWQASASAAFNDMVGGIGGMLQDNVVNPTVDYIKSTNFGQGFEHGSDVYSHDKIISSSLGTHVDIFMPQSIQINDSATYDASTSLGRTGRFIGAMTGEGGVPGVDELSRLAGAGIGDIVNAFTSGSAAGNISSSQLASLANKMPGDVGIAASHGFGVVLDPVNITTFKEVPIRQFSFTYKFIPSSRDDAKAIEKIIKFFRTELYPEREGWALKYPNAFQIEQVYFDKDTRKVLNKFLKSHLVAVSSTYNPTSNGMMADGSWSEIDLTLTFQEERALHKADIMEGS